MTTQTVIPGAEEITQAHLAQRKADAPLRPKAPQKPLEHGLWSDQAQQIDLMDYLRKDCPR